MAAKPQEKVFRLVPVINGEGLILFSKFQVGNFFPGCFGSLFWQCQPPSLKKKKNGYTSEAVQCESLLCPFLLRLRSLASGEQWHLSFKASFFLKLLKLEQ